MYDLNELDDLRKMAPPGFYAVPSDTEERCQVIVVGDVKKSVTKDWFAIFPDSRGRAKFERVLMGIVEQRLMIDSA
jgi:hypothetical protein